MTRPPVERGRYKIRNWVDPETGEIVAEKSMQRTTNFIKPAKDDYSLQNWSKRMVAVGVARNDHLVLQAARLDPTDRDDRDALDEITEAAMDAVGANDKREIGTALHKLTEDIDLGRDVAISGQYKADIAAYRQLLADHDIEIIPEWVEVPVVVDHRLVAGTVDRVVKWRGRHMILDLKTGNVEYSWGQIACQLAVYAEGHIYDHSNGSRTPFPDDLDRNEALVVHLPAGKGEARLYTVNIDVGRVLDAISVISEFRRARNLAELQVPADRPEPDEEPTLEEVEEAVAKIEKAFGPEVDEFGFTVAAGASPTRVDLPKPDPVTDRPAEGDIDDGEWENKARDAVDLDALGEDRTAVMLAWRNEAQKDGWSWHFAGQVSSERRYWIYRLANELLLDTTIDMDMEYLLLAWALQHPHRFTPGEPPDVPFGVLLGRLDHIRAAAAVTALRLLQATEVSVQFDEFEVPQLSYPDGTMLNPSLPNGEPTTRP